jgi:UrcA family protein
MSTIHASPRFRGLIATAIACAIASSFATVCAAADSNDFPSVVVKFGDLNVSNSRGAAALYGRIKAAARDVCKAYDVSSGRFQRASTSDPCVRKAIEEAVTKVGQPALFAIYNAKHPQPLPITVASAKTR